MAGPEEEEETPKSQSEMVEEEIHNSFNAHLEEQEETEDTEPEESQE